MSGNLPDPYSEGYDGAIIADIAKFINGSLSSIETNVVLIHAGTNDMKTGPSIQITRRSG